MMKVSTRVTVLVAVMTAGLLATSAAGLLLAREGLAALKSVYEDRTVPAAQLARIAHRMDVNRTLLLEAAMRGQAGDAVERVNANAARITEDWNAYMATSLTAEEAGLAKSYVAQREQFLEQGLRPAMSAVTAGQWDRAREVLSGPAARTIGAASATLDQLVELQTRVAKTEYDEAVQRERTGLAVLSGLIVVALAVGLGLGWSLVRYLTRELGAEPDAVRQAARAVAQGDLAAPVPVRRGDEHSLMATMARMRESIAQTVRSVRDGAESVATASAQIA